MDPRGLAEAYARLKALRDNIPEGRKVGHHHLVYEQWGDEYHQILETLERASGEDLQRFRTNVVLYNEVERYQRETILMRIDALLTYFDLRFANPPSEIGFRPR